MIKYNKKSYKGSYGNEEVLENYIITDDLNFSAKPTVKPTVKPHYKDWVVSDVKDMSGFNFAVLTLSHPDHSHLKYKSEGTYRFLRLDRNNMDEIYFYTEGINTDNESFIVFPVGETKMLFKPTRKQKKQIEKVLKKHYQDECHEHHWFTVIWRLWYFIRHNYHANKFMFWIISTVIVIIMSTWANEIFNSIHNFAQNIINYWVEK